MKVVVAKVASTLILWLRASLLASPTVVPASTVPWRWIAPVRARIASSSVVLPLWNGPTSAMHRGPEFLIELGPEPFCPIAPSLAGRETRSNSRPAREVAMGQNGSHLGTAPRAARRSGKVHLK